MGGPGSGRHAREGPDPEEPADMATYVSRKMAILADLMEGTLNGKDIAAKYGVSAMSVYMVAAEARRAGILGRTIPVVREVVRKVVVSARLPANRTFQIIKDLQDRELTFREIATKYGITTQRVQQISKKAVAAGLIADRWENPVRKDPTKSAAHRKLVDDTAKAREMVASGNPLELVAAGIGRSVMWVKRVCMDLPQGQRPSRKNGFIRMLCVLAMLQNKDMHMEEIARKCRVATSWVSHVNHYARRAGVNVPYRPRFGHEGEAERPPPVWKQDGARLGGDFD